MGAVQECSKTFTSHPERQVAAGRGAGSVKGATTGPSWWGQALLQVARRLLAAAPREQAGDRRWAEVRKGQGSVLLAAAGCTSNLYPTGGHSAPCPLDVREKMLL